MQLIATKVRHCIVPRIYATAFTLNFPPSCSTPICLDVEFPFCPEAKAKQICLCACYARTARSQQFCMETIAKAVAAAAPLRPRLVSERSSASRCPPFVARSTCGAVRRRIHQFQAAFAPAFVHVRPGPRAGIGGPGGCGRLGAHTYSQGTGHRPGRTGARTDTARSKMNASPRAPLQPWPVAASADPAWLIRAAAYRIMRRGSGRMRMRAGVYGPARAPSNGGCVLQLRSCLFFAAPPHCGQPGPAVSWPGADGRAGHMWRHRRVIVCVRSRVLENGIRRRSHSGLR